MIDKKELLRCGLDEDESREVMKINKVAVKGLIKLFKNDAENVIASSGKSDDDCRNSIGIWKGLDRAGQIINTIHR